MKTDLTRGAMLILLASTLSLSACAGPGEPDPTVRSRATAAAGPNSLYQRLTLRESELGQRRTLPARFVENLPSRSQRALLRQVNIPALVHPEMEHVRVVPAAVSIRTNGLFHGIYMSVRGTNLARRYSHLHPAEAPARTGALVTESEGVVSASFVFAGLAYDMELECAGALAECEDENAIQRLVDELVIVPPPPTPTLADRGDDTPGSDDPRPGGSGDDERDHPNADPEQ